MNIEAYNFSLFEKLSEKELGDWMYDGFVLIPASGRDGRSNLLHAQQIYKSLSENLRQKVDRVLINSLKTWSQEAGNESIDNMATYAALTQNKAAVPLLVGMIDSGNLQPNLEGEADPFTTVIAVLGGFAKESEAKKALKRWYSDPSFSWAHIALLATGLAYAGEPLKKIMPRLIETMDAHPKYFREDLVAAELAGIVGADDFENEVKNFEGRSARKMKEFMPLIREILKQAEDIEKLR